MLLVEQHSPFARNETLTTTIVNHSAVRTHALLANLLVSALLEQHASSLRRRSTRALSLDPHHLHKLTQYC